MVSVETGNIMERTTMCSTIFLGDKKKEEESYMTGAVHRHWPSRLGCSVFRMVCPILIYPPLLLEMHLLARFFKIDNQSNLFDQSHRMCKIEQEYRSFLLQCPSSFS